MYCICRLEVFGSVNLARNPRVIAFEMIGVEILP